MPIEELSLEGMDIDSGSWAGEVLRTDFGGGYGAKVVVGGVSGLYRWTISSGCLPDGVQYGNLIDGLPRFKYYFEFFKRHTTGTNDVFIIDFRGLKFHACFVEPEMQFEMFTYDLFGGPGIEIRQRKLPGVIYNEDGSVDVIPPTTPFGLALEVLSPTSLRATWLAAEDPIESDGDAPGYPESLALEVLGTTSLRATWDEASDPAPEQGGGGGANVVTSDAVTVTQDSVPVTHT